MDISLRSTSLTVTAIALSAKAASTRLVMEPLKDCESVSSSRHMEARARVARLPGDRPVVGRACDGGTDLGYFSFGYLKLGDVSSRVNASEHQCV